MQTKAEQQEKIITEMEWILCVIMDNPKHTTHSFKARRCLAKVKAIRAEPVQEIDKVRECPACVAFKAEADKY